MSDKKKQKVYVAMSGGVDSSVAAVLLKDQGYDVVGVTMSFQPPSVKTGKFEVGCHSQAITDAKKVADQLDIPHLVLDFAQELETLIIQDFIQEYVEARTPNPCVRCNRLIKFGVLWEKIKEMGGDYLATGHYARIEGLPEEGQFALKKAVDLKKDQSYFLYGIAKEYLPHLLFPLGRMVKDEVRDVARKFALPIAEKKESQDICFVPDDGYKNFIRQKTGDALFVPGDFIDENGEVVGRHQGIINYTIGQRDKLGIALGHRAYVNRIDRTTNTVHVGPKDCLYAKGLTAKSVNLLAEKNEETIEAAVRIRYNAKDVKATVHFLADESVKVLFDEPQLSVTPGQSLVIYQDDRVLAGGIIEEALKE